MVNTVTSLRGIIAAAAIPLVVRNDVSLINLQVAAGMVTSAFALDALDGWLARRLNVESVAGAYLDAVIDGVALAANLCALTMVIYYVNVFDLKEIIKHLWLLNTPALAAGICFGWSRLTSEIKRARG